MLSRSVKLLDAKLQIHEPKMKVDPFEKIMLSRSIKLSDAKSPKSPTWRASCRCLTTNSLPWGYPGQYVRASAYAELDG